MQPTCTLILALLLFAQSPLYAQFYGGTLQVAHASPEQPNATKLLFTATLFGPSDADSVPDSLSLNLGYFSEGDMVSEEIPLISTSPLEDELNQYTYALEWVVPSRIAYLFSVEACCLEPAFDNLSTTAPQPLFLPTLYTFPNPQFVGVNNGAVFAVPLQQQATTSTPLNAVLSASDTEGDSIALSLYDPETFEGDFLLPNEIDNGGTANFSLSSDGQLQWDTPTEAGKSYLLPVQVSEYRNGIVLGTSIAYFRLSTTSATSSTPLNSGWAVSAYPNPTKGALVISAPASARLSATLINLQGQLLRQWVGLQDGQRIHLGQTPGVYLLSLTDGKRIKTLRIVVAGE